MRHKFNPAVVQIPLLEVDDALRRMLVANRRRSTAEIIAIHLFLRVRRRYQFRRNSGEEATIVEVMERIVDAIWSVPERTLAEFAEEELVRQVAASEFIAREVSRALTEGFRPVYVSEPYGDS